jgi:hypothetical protein
MRELNLGGSAPTRSVSFERGSFAYPSAWGVSLVVAALL